MYYILPPSPSALERYRLFKDCIWLSVFLFFLSFLRRVCIYPSLSLDAARRAAAVPYVFHSGFLSATRQPRFLRVPTRVLFGRPGSCGGTLPSSFHLWTVVSPDLHRRPAIRRHGPTSCRGAAIHRQLLARTSKMLAHRNPSVFALNLSSASGESTNLPAIRYSYLVGITTVFPSRAQSGLILRVLRSPCVKVAGQYTCAET